MLERLHCFYPFKVITERGAIVVASSRFRISVERGGPGDKYHSVDFKIITESLLTFFPIMYLVLSKTMFKDKS